MNLENAAVPATAAGWSDGRAGKEGWEGFEARMKKKARRRQGRPAGHYP